MRCVNRFGAAWGLLLDNTHADTAACVRSLMPPNLFISAALHLPKPPSPKQAHSPPAVVLRAQLHVRAQHRDLAVDDDCEQADEEHKAKQVVEVAQPQAGHGKVQLNEHGAKGKDACVGRRVEGGGMQQVCRREMGRRAAHSVAQHSTARNSTSCEQRLHISSCIFRYGRE